MMATITREQLRIHQAQATGPRTTTQATGPISGGHRDRLPYKDACRLPMAKIIPDPDQPRKTFDDASLERTARSLQSVGQIVPIVVRRDEAADRFVIIDGERRWRAAQRAGLTELSAVVDEKANEATVLEVQLVVNALREDVNAMEQGRAWDRLAKLTGKSLRQLAEMLNYDHASIGRKISLLSLPEEIQAAIAANEISQETGVGLTQIADPIEQAELAGRAKAGDLPRPELRERIARSKASVAAASKAKGRGTRLSKPKLPAKMTFKADGGIRILAERAKGLGLVAVVAALEQALQEARGRLASEEQPAA